MKQKALLAALRARTGPVCVEVQNYNDTFWMQAVKSDLIFTLSSKFRPDEETGFTLDDDGFFGKDFDSNARAGR